jgi:hypothetical protein
MKLRSEEARHLEAIVAGFPHVAGAVEDVPVEQLWRALEAAERSYWRTLRQSGFSESKCQTWTSAIMRRLKGHVAADGLTEEEMLRKLYEELGCLDEFTPAEIGGFGQ